MSGIGHIEYENKDTTPMNEQKERYLYFHRYYINKGKNIATTIAVLDYFTTHQEDFQNISTLSPAFMSAVINNFWAQAVIGLYGFYHKSDDLSFEKFFCYVKSNWNLIFTGDFYETIYHGEEKRTERVKFTREKILQTIEECRKIVAENQEKIDLLGKFRDNLFAHYGDVSKERIAVSLSIDELQDIFQITEHILNKIEVIYDRVTTSFTPVYTTDICQTCHAINKYKEYRDKIRELDMQKMNIQTGGVE